MKQVEIAADVVEQFGNMIALRKRKEQDFPGIAQLFVASVIQCQPLAEVEFLFPSGQAVELKEVKATHTPVSHTRVYESEQFLVHEEIVVHRDCAAVQLTATLKEDMQDDMDLKLRGWTARPSISRNLKVKRYSL